MLKNLSNFAIVRRGWQLFGFYVTWLLIILLLSFIGGLIVGLLFPTPGGFSEGFQKGIGIGAAVAIICSMGMAILVSRAKKFTLLTSILWVLGSAALAAIGGGILGLIIPTYLTSKQVSTEGETVNEVPPSS